MRRIKFRAWDPEYKCMVYDFDQNIHERYAKLGQSIHNAVYNIGLGFKTLQQFTGLIDKNGKEIYEGDIVSFRGEGVNIGHVVYNEELCRFEFGILYIMDNEKVEEKEPWLIENIAAIEVIGNIHEKPESLK